MFRSKKSVIVLLIFAYIHYSLQDVSHFFAQAPELSYFQHHHHLAPQHGHIPVGFQSGISALYGPPSNGADLSGLYPNPIGPSSEVVTPAPVAPISTSTESLLPEIVENRSAKDRRNFIPLLKQYLPPAPPVADERPNYESPQQGNQQYDPFNGGYIYQKPTTTSTTTPRPTQAIVVVDSPEFLPPINNDPIILPPINNDPFEQEHSSDQGYNYPRPSTPSIVAADTPFHETSSTPAPGYLPPSNGQQQLSVVQGADNVMSLRLRVHEMRCLQQKPQANGYFRAVLKIDNFLSATPSVDNDSSDKRCELKLHKSYVVVDIAGEDFQRCGVQQCGSDLCLRLRFPAIRGMRTGSDSILTLHCKSQSRVAVKTHALKMGVSNDVQARSIGTYAKGGTQNSFRTHVELLRKSAQGYARHLHANEAVQLGEDLLLRAHVLSGDGWNYTKLSDVSLQRISPSGEILNNVQLITSQGCLNPSMKGICTQTPSFDAPLGYKLPFKAVMFQGMRSGEELIMSMRITGCLEQQDCYVNTDQCNNFNTSNLKRRKRDLFNSTSHNNTEISEISKISFRVIMPGEESTEQNYNPESLKAQSKSLILFGSLGFIALLICLGIFALFQTKKY
ncbi:hypothetical protein FF38_04461 [Lucilia cuprina]|uniref:ZP domain-containing protein n=1 Tax=Lucilia cuprina TaxID=7375 RepID=A0A0L0CHI8_LUCCU|nr:hypothetical protein CVS40_4601 [Lucilia cuprina]KNC30939.1 hypothetical protein FF38_04461 [Lucilia cuprina]